MNHAELLKRYLEREEDVDVADHGYPFVTISRQPGAGGHTLGREIIRHLDARPDETWNRGWDLFDQKLCAYLAQDPENQASFDSLLREEYEVGLHQQVYEMFVGRVEQYLLQKRIAGVVRFLAYIGKVVIIGRAGMCVASDLRTGIHVRLVAPEEHRVRRMMEVLGNTLEEARREMRKQEQERARLVRDYYGKNIDDPLLYDVVFNTGSMDNETMARTVACMAAERRVRTCRSRRLPFEA